MTTPIKVYLGDGAYAEYDGFGIILTTEDGVSISNRIVLEPDMINRLIQFANTKFKVKAP